MILVSLFFWQVSPKQRQEGVTRIRESTKRRRCLWTAWKRVLASSAAMPSARASEQRENGEGAHPRGGGKRSSKTTVQEGVPHPTARRSLTALHKCTFPDPVPADGSRNSVRQILRTSPRRRRSTTSRSRWRWTRESDMVVGSVSGSVSVYGVWYQCTVSVSQGLGSGCQYCVQRGVSMY